MTLNAILQRVEGTGGEPGGYIFKHVAITEAEVKVLENESGSIARFAGNNGIDFVSVQKTGTIRFLHVTDVKNEDSVTMGGLVTDDGNWEGDLGSGIYVIEKGNGDALDNLKTFVADNSNGDSLLLVNGTYSGRYLYCIYGGQNKGFVLLQDNVPNTNIHATTTYTIGDFLYTG